MNYQYQGFFSYFTTSFEIHEGKVEEFKDLIRVCFPLAQKEEKCVISQFSFHENIQYVREACEDTKGLIKYFVVELCSQKFRR